MTEADATTSKRWARVGQFAPVMQWLPKYERKRLPVDMLAGAIVAALLVPQSLGYATIAGVPVQVGLYAVPLALLAYAVLGSSPQLIVGPASTVAIVSGSLVADISRRQPTGRGGHHVGAGDRRRPGPGRGRRPPDLVARGVPVETDRDRLRPRSLVDHHHR